ncbi:MAG TPA: hypothetical protein PK514_05010 [Spirochaetota bacterium]|nr:hypothetical protein [Spirochaetota bacterium]
MKNLLKITVPVLAVIILASMLPRIIPCVDTSQFTGNYRIPYSLGEDYFFYEKYVETVAASCRIAFIGDSVIWGHYTDSSSSLTAYLNAASGTQRFANIGIDGIHPAALNGLINNYCTSLKNGRVIIGINLLWMSSPKHDLSGETNSSINHRALLTQFPGKIPAYSPAAEERLTLLARRDIPLFTWLEHMRSSEFAERNVYRWTMANPYANPEGYFVHKDEVFTPPDPVRPDRMTGRDMEWVLPEKSLQWRYMLDSIRRLKEQGNSVIAVITPFNTFMLTEKSRLERDMIISAMQNELASDGITAFAPVLDKAEYYADLSHPVAAGYGIIASQLMSNDEFSEFVK